MLRPIQNIFDPADYPDLMVGLADPDDAAVWRIDDERALVVTTDFFTPVVDTPYEYGAIAAANSLSDIYAMGGTPFLALNVAALPPDLPVDYASEILRGGAEKAREAGVVIAGGHTVQDKEPKYGLVAIGFVHPDKMLTKTGARPGDALVLTKPLGFGTTTTAIKQGKASHEEIDEVIGWMARLNETAGQLAVEFGLHGGTDITGFSLLGHACEMAEASQVGLQFNFEELPFISGAHKYAADFVFPGGASDNRLYYNSHINFGHQISEASQMLLFDPQTSGGLLLAVPRKKYSDFMTRSRELSQPAWHVGEVLEGSGIQILR